MLSVDIKPDVLEFSSPFTVQSTEYVTITNTSESETIAFKVKTTAPKFYCVRPNSGTVSPGESVEVQVILLGLVEEPVADFKCKDKFLVITLPSPYDLNGNSVSSVWPQLEAEFKKEAVSKKMKVKYNITADQPTKNGQSSVQTSEEKKQDFTQPPTVKPAEEGSVESAPVSATEDASKEEFEDEPAVAPASTESNPSATRSNVRAKKIPTVHTQESSLNTNTLIIIALVAIILGWLYH